MAVLVLHLPEITTGGLITWRLAKAPDLAALPAVTVLLIGVYLLYSSVPARVVDAITVGSCRRRF